jgi:tetratricopeptide (TPR) repeat protein
MHHNRTKPRLLVLLGVGVFLLCGAPFCGAQKAASSPRTGSPLSVAKAQLDHGDLDSGEKTLWDILSGNPNNQDALTMLGVVRGRQKRYAEAEALFRRVLQLNPKSAVASRNLAGALMAQGKEEDALKEYLGTIQLVPRDTDLKIEVARLYLRHGSFAEALSILGAIKPEHFPSSAIPLEAAALLGVGRRSDAEALIPSVKGTTAATLDLADVFIETNDAEAALKTLALVAAPGKGFAARACYLRGRALRQSGKMSAATASFQQALVSDPKSVETLIAMSETLAVQNKHADSLRTLERAQQLRPESPEILRHMVVEAMQAGENDKALLAAQNLQSKSSQLDDRYLVASVMVQQKQYLPATHILEDYVAQRPQDAKAYLGLGIAYLNQMRYDDAGQALEHSLQINPALAEADYQLGLLAAQQGGRQKAIQHWEKAVAEQPHHAQALFSLGTMYLESGELEKAQSAFERSLRADPTNMKTEYDLALVLNKLGKPEEAKEHLARYRKMQEAEHTVSENPPRASDRQ